MEPGREPLLIYIAVPDQETAGQIGRRAVEERLAACANILPSISSCYHWEGRLQEDQEAVLILKTTADAADALRSLVERLHPYETPAILTIPLQHVNPPYYAWMREEVQPPQPTS